MCPFLKIHGPLRGPTVYQTSYYIDFNVGCVIKIYLLWLKLDPGLEIIGPEAERKDIKSVHQLKSIYLWSCNKFKKKYCVLNI